MSHSTDLRAPRQGRWSRLCLKELRETLRDRRTLTTLILMPLLVYPILSMVFQRSLLTNVIEQPKLVIGVRSQQDAIKIRDQLTLAEKYLEQEKRLTRSFEDDLRGKEQADGEQPVDERLENNKSFEEVASPDDSSQERASMPMSDLGQRAAMGTLSPGPATARTLQLDDLVFREVLDMEQAVRNEHVDLAIAFTHAGHFRLTYRETSALSAQALEYLEERLRALNEIDLRQRLVMARQRSGIAVRVFRQPLSVESRRNSTLSTIVPMILILMTVTGAVYPAIDLTAGERERGTLEMLMASPVPRFRLLLAKYVAVVVVAFLTALVNLAAMTITLWATGLSRALLGDAGIGFTRIVQILALLVLFAAFFSAVLLSLTSFARSFKEAQAYLIPLMLLSLGPGIVSLLPGLELNGVLAITPISNIVLLARDLCGGSVNSAMACAAILSTALYTLAALGVAAKIFGADAVLSGPNASFQTLLRETTDNGGQFPRAPCGDGRWRNVLLGGIVSRILRCAQRPRPARPYLRILDGTAFGHFRAGNQYSVWSHSLGLRAHAAARPAVCISIIPLHTSVLHRGLDVGIHGLADRSRSRLADAGDWLCTLVRATLAAWRGVLG